MAGCFRKIIASKVFRTLIQSGLIGSRPEPCDLENKLAALVRLRRTSKRQSAPTNQFQIQLEDIKKFIIPETNASQLRQIFGKDEALQNLIEDEILSASLDVNCLVCGVHPIDLTQKILETIYKEKSRYGCVSHLHSVQLSAGELQILLNQRNTVVIEYSSPNIAKPFHAGHLRSTIIGNFISNLYEILGHNVIRLNYLGDWGTQFGLLVVGFQKYGNLEELDNNPMDHLLQVYIKVNKDVELEKNGIITGTDGTYTQGQEVFQKMELGAADAVLSLWQKFRDLSIQEYVKMYKRLRIQFTEYHGEAMYRKKAAELLEKLKAMKLLEIEQATGVGYVEVGQPEKPLKAKVVKSDGTSLYLTRDIAAAFDRHNRYNFDRIHYVVETSQHQHFHQLLGVLKKMKVRWIDRSAENMHIRFGRVLGMSTRRGDMVLLKDIIDEAQHRMLDVMKSKTTTKELNDLENVADVLGISGIIVQDLKERRMHDYSFSWEKSLNFKSDSGIFLQYAHARLCSLERNCEVPLPSFVSADEIQEDEAVKLVLHLARYDEALWETRQTLEPHRVVQYLFKLGHLANAALYRLHVLGQAQQTAEARLFMFHCTRLTLANGLRLLGLQPLERM